MLNQDQRIKETPTTLTCYGMFLNLTVYNRYEVLKWPSHQPAMFHYGMSSVPERGTNFGDLGNLQAFLV